MDNMPINSVQCKLNDNDVINIRTFFIDCTYIDTIVYIHGDNCEIITVDVCVHTDMNEKHYVIPVYEFMYKLYNESLVYYIQGPTPSIHELYHDVSNTIYNIVSRSAYMNIKEN